MVGEDQVKILPKSPISERGHGTQVFDMTKNRLMDATKSDKGMEVVK